MPIFAGMFPSPRKDKKYRIIIKNPDMNIDFGLKGSQTYVDHGDETKRANYLSRHRKNEDWTKLNAGSASARILWGDSTNIKQNLKDYQDYFDMEVPKGAKIILYTHDTPETKEYKKVKQQTVKFERDEAQKELSDISKFQKLKQQTVKYERDEAQKDLRSIAQTAMQKDIQDKYKDYPILVPQLYDLQHKYKLLKPVTWSKELKPKVEKLKKYIIKIKDKLGSNLSKFITRNQYDDIHSLEPIKLGIISDTSIESKIFSITDEIVMKAKELLSQLK
jgi:hypothetical protein